MTTTTTVDDSNSVPSEVQKPADKRNLSYVLRSGLAGGVAGCIAKTVVAPLERVKILFQTSHFEFVQHSTRRLGFFHAIQDIRRSQGIYALFQGHSVTLLRIFPYAAINFLAYEQIRAAIIASPDQETPFRRLISGSMAGATSTSCTYPFELIRIRLAVQTKRTSLRDICRKIYHEGGSNPTLANFYRGFAPTLLGILPYAGMSFCTHDIIGDWLRSPMLSPYTTLPQSKRTPSNTRHVRLTAVAELFSGAVAGLVAQTASYPLEIIRRRMQVSVDTATNGRRPGIADTVRTIFRERGVRGFYVGLTIGYIKIIPMVATSFFVYERMKWYLGLY